MQTKVTFGWLASVLLEAPCSVRGSCVAGDGGFGVTWGSILWEAVKIFSNTYPFEDGLTDVRADFRRTWVCDHKETGERVLLSERGVWSHMRKQR